MSHFITLLLIFLMLPSIAFAEDEVQHENIDHVMQERALQMKQQLLEKGPYFSLKGELRHLGGKTYSINGEEFQLEETTRIEGSLSNGSFASVHGTMSGSKKIAQVVKASEKMYGKGGTSSLVDKLGEIGSRPVTPPQ